MTPTTICPANDPAGYVFQVDLMITAAGSPPAYKVVMSNPDDPEAHDLLNAKGDLDFSDSNKAVAAIVNLKDSSGLGLKFADTGKYQVFSFGKDYNGGNKLPIDGNHYQLRHLQLDSTGTVVSVCYRNTQNDDDNPHLHHRKSRYGVYLIDDRQNIYPIDPGVGNGANK
jgi:hypothetical protein